jgi:hypothetical protein
MTKNIILTLLALTTITCAVLEGLVDGLPAQFVQLNGLLTIVCTATFIGWALKLQVRQFLKD